PFHSFSPTYSLAAGGRCPPPVHLAVLDAGRGAAPDSPGLAKLLRTAWNLPSSCLSPRAAGVTGEGRHAGDVVIRFRFLFVATPKKNTSRADSSLGSVFPSVRRPTPGPPQ
ncbi:hypothetical protein H1C71_032198, partial [Ictidomys tridecemlineatus]